jgi:hydrogenase-1 operon protein HyaE
MNPLHPLVARLVELIGQPLLTAENLDELTTSSGDVALFCGGDPIQHPECLDVAVVLPELLTVFRGRFRAVVASASLEPQLLAMYGFQRWPSLVFLRDGQYIGVISGIQDWSVYLERITDLLSASPSRPPSVGIAVSAPANHCH